MSIKTKAAEQEAAVTTEAEAAPEGKEDTEVVTDAAAETEVPAAKPKGPTVKPKAATKKKAAPAASKRKWRACSNLSNRGEQIAQPGDIVELSEELAKHYLSAASGSIEPVHD